MITPKEIEATAKLSGLEDWTEDGNWRGVTDDLIRFAGMIAAAEHEACTRRMRKMSQAGMVLVNRETLRYIYEASREVRCHNLDELLEIKDMLGTARTIDSVGLL